MTVSSEAGIEAFAPMLAVAASATRTDPARLNAVAATLLALDASGDGDHSGRSGLNYDETPLQLCFSIGAEGLHARLLADPAARLGNQAMRFRAACEALQAVATASGSTSMLPLCERTLDATMPADREHLRDYPDGVMWVGAGVDTPGLAMYVDARRGGPAESWPRLREWFAQMLPSRDATDAAVEAIAPNAEIMCLGVEGISPRTSRAKFYWRLREPAPLAAFGVERFADERFVRFVSTVMGSRDIRLSGVVPSIGFRIESGALSDVKLDLCACRRCVDLSPQEWQSVVRALVEPFGLEVPPVEEWLQTTEMAFIGFGIDRDDLPRVNIYLKSSRG